MSIIDNITVILGPPAAHEEQERLQRQAEASGETLDDTYIKGIADIVSELTARSGDGMNELERCLSELLELPVRLKSATPTWFEKKGKRDPAILLAAADVTDVNGCSLEEAVTAAFTRLETPAKFSERIGVHLGLESAKTFYTFGVKD